MDFAGVDVTSDVPQLNPNTLVGKTNYPLSEWKRSHPHLLEVGFDLHGGLQPAIQIDCVRCICGNVGMKMGYNGWSDLCSFQVEFRVREFARDAKNAMQNGFSDGIDDVELQLAYGFKLKLTTITSNVKSALVGKDLQEEDLFNMEIVRGRNIIVLNDSEVFRMFQLGKGISSRLHGLQKRGFPAIYKTFIGDIINANHGLNIELTDEEREAILIESELQTDHFLSDDFTNVNYFIIQEIIICHPDQYLKDVAVARSLACRRLSFSEDSEDTGYHSACSTTSS